MKPHGLNTRVRSSHPAARRRFTVSVILAGGPMLAARLVGWLKWRGFAFDRVVTRPDGEDAATTRVVFTFTTCLDGGRVLMETIARYAPVEAVRQFYAAPVVGSDADGPMECGSTRERDHPVLAGTGPRVALCDYG
ncbi:MAG: hypothetical protein ACFB6R_15680 [Alphaproteobacteria bacterium]